MIAKILFRGFNFICGCLVFLIMAIFAAAYFGLFTDPKHGDIDIDENGWNEVLKNSIVRGWKHIANGFKS